MAKADLTAQRLRELLHYDPETGVFTWIKPSSRRVKVGMPAATEATHGYYKIGVDKTEYGAHRLAWLYVHGTWPKQHIDHINGDQKDNRIANLRDVDRFVNLQNRRRANKGSASGLLGAYWRADKGRWKSCIAVGPKQVHLGYHDTPEAAHQAYLEAKRRLHPGCTL